MSGAPGGNSDKIPEIEITDEMVDAGVRALALWDWDDRSEWKVSDVYREMERARLSTAALKPQKEAEAAKETDRRLSNSNK
jgi:hypothetical protein